MRNLQIETITTATGKQDVIRDVDAVRAIIKDVAQLEASLRLAADSLNKSYCALYGYISVNKVHPDSLLMTAKDNARETLSTIRTNHPQLMEGEK
jgi:hypothetical protein